MRKACYAYVTNGPARRQLKASIRRSLSLGVFLVAVATLGTAQVPGKTVIKWQPVKLTNGSPVLFELTAQANLQSVSAQWVGHHVEFFHAPKSRSWYALAGVSLETSPGIYDLQVTSTSANGETRKSVKKIRIFRASYPRITVKVAKQYTEPNQQQLSSISADKGIKQKTFAEVSQQRLWSGPFMSPVDKPVSDVFGTERVFNQEVQSRHQGLDFAAPAGTPVRAINRGVVLLARPMYFEGNCVILDHGQGLLSLYLHLSEFKVKEGDEVRSGDVIAVSGGTGRATGPHLHLAIRWQGVYLNPAILLKMQLPRF